MWFGADDVSECCRPHGGAPPTCPAAPWGGSWLWGAGLLRPHARAELGLIWGVPCRPSMLVLGLRWALGSLVSPGSPLPSELGPQCPQGQCSVQTRLGLCRSLRAGCRRSPGSVRWLDGGESQLGAWPPVPGSGPDPAVCLCTGAAAPALCVHVSPPQEQGATAAAHGLGVRGSQGHGRSRGLGGPWGSALHIGEKQGCPSMRRGEAVLPLLPVGLLMEGLAARVGEGTQRGQPLRAIRWSEGTPWSGGACVHLGLLCRGPWGCRPAQLRGTRACHAAGGTENSNGTISAPETL